MADDTTGRRHAVVVGPNSGYHTDNRCLLDVLERAQGRFRGVAVVPDSTPREELLRLREAGVVGTTFQAQLLGVENVLAAGPLLSRLA